MDPMDPEHCVLGIGIVSLIQGLKDPGSGSASKSSFNPKNSYISRILALHFLHPGSRGQKSTGSRVRNRNTVIW